MEPSNGALAKLFERVLTELASLRDELRVQNVIVRRIDGTAQRLEQTVASVLDELRATHEQIEHVTDRVSKLEDRAS